MSVRAGAAVTALLIAFGAVSAVPVQARAAQEGDKAVVLRVCNWEEYID